MMALVGSFKETNGGDWECSFPMEARDNTFAAYPIAQPFQSLGCVTAAAASNRLD